AFHAPQGLADAVEIHFGVDHRRYEARRHLLHGVGHVFHAAAEGAEDLELLLEQLHQVHRGRYAGSRAACYEPAASPEREHGTGPRIRTDMLEDDIDALLLRELADDSLEAVLAVIDDVVGTQRRRLLHLVG